MRLNRKKKAFYTILRAKVQKKNDICKSFYEKNAPISFFYEKGRFFIYKKALYCSLLEKTPKR